MLTPSSNPILHNQGSLCPLLISEKWSHPAIWLLRFPWSTAERAWDSSPSSKPLFGTIQLWNSVWSGNFARCISEEGWLGIVMPLGVQVPIPAAWWVIDLRQFLPSRLFSLALTEKQGKGIDRNGSSLPLFSIPSLVWIPDGVANFLESLCNSSSTRRASRQIKNVLRKTSLLSCISLHSRFAARLSGTRRNIKAWCETWALPKLLGESRSWKIFESSINSNRTCNFRTWSRNRLTVRDPWSCCIAYPFIFCLVTSFSSWLQCLFNSSISWQLLAWHS